MTIASVGGDFKAATLKSPLMETKKKVGILDDFMKGNFSKQFQQLGIIPDPKDLS